jgi:hypothetical protein
VTLVAFLPQIFGGYAFVLWYFYLRLPHELMYEDNFIDGFMSIQGV